MKRHPPNGLKVAITPLSGNRVPTGAVWVPFVFTTRHPPNGLKVAITASTGNRVPKVPCFPYSQEEKYRERGGSRRSPEEHGTHGTQGQLLV